MQKMVYTCDHCGKKMNEMTDYVDISFDIIDNWIHTDLCLECYEKISHIIKEFCSREHQNEKEM